jgi:hypothetical protein
MHVPQLSGQKLRKIKYLQAVLRIRIHQSEVCIRVLLSFYLLFCDLHHCLQEKQCSKQASKIKKFPITQTIDLKLNYENTLSMMIHMIKNAVPFSSLGGGGGSLLKLLIVLHGGGGGGRTDELFA